jgi:hypothetical protein
MSLLLTLACAMELKSQSAATAASPAHLEACNKGRDQMLAHTDIAERRRGMSMMLQARCTSIAVGALSEAWRRVGADDVVMLASITSRLADRRLIDTLANVAADPLMPTHTRLNALGTLVAYADPSAFVDFRPGVRPDSVRIGVVSHTSQRAGEYPLTDADRRSIPDGLERIARASADRSLASSASSLASQLRSRLRVRDSLRVQ